MYSKADSHQLRKPVLIIVITDGQPTGQGERHDRVTRVIAEAKRKLASSVSEDAVSFSIAAVGNDADAQAFLDRIDSHPEVGDLVDVTSDLKAEAYQVKKATGIELTSELHCLKILLGSIDSSYDQSDEPPSGKQSRKEQVSSST